MADGKVLEFSGVTKVFGDVSAVSDLTARVEPGVVTAVLGPNGAGKTTSLRILLGEIRPSSGKATIGGSTYSSISHPARTVGAVLETPTFKQRRTATRQLTSVAKSNGIPLPRVREVLDLVGLSDVADMRIASYSLGMRQRLSIAQALLGDPGMLVFDEPVNGMDPEGIRWMRLLMRRLADEGRTVLMSSHLLSEVQQIADRILIVSNGKLVFSGNIEDLADVDPIVVVDSPDREKLSRVLREGGYEFEVLRSGVNVRDARARDLGKSAAEAGIALSVLHQRGASLEDVFLDLVNGRPTRQTAALPSREAEETAADAPAAAVPDAAEDGRTQAAESGDAIDQAPADDAAGGESGPGAGMGAVVAGAAAGAAAVGIAGAAGANVGDGSGEDTTRAADDEGADAFGESDGHDDHAERADDDSADATGHADEVSADADADAQEHEDAIEHAADDEDATEHAADDENTADFGDTGAQDSDEADSDAAEESEDEAEAASDAAAEAAADDDGFAGETHTDEDDAAQSPAMAEEVDEAHPDSRPLPGADRLAHLLNDEEDATREIPTFPLLGAPEREEGQDEAASDSDDGSSPWSAGPSFADRLGATAGAAATDGDAPASEDENASRLSEEDLSDPAFVALGETEPISQTDLGDLVEGDEDASADEPDAASDAEPEQTTHDAADGTEPEPTTQEIAFDSFVAEFGEGDQEQQ
ncbi:putative ABC transporter ATP-binding protein [Frigoribacterium sp. JB110]|nr:putative ABC transporter ATP-binding protein [Frigoribacterium sp. JB110]